MASVAVSPFSEPRECEAEQDRDEQYLAQASDIYDLERRMREIDQRGRCAANDLTFSLGLR